MLNPGAHMGHNHRHVISGESYEAVLSGTSITASPPQRRASISSHRHRPVGVGAAGLGGVEALAGDLPGAVVDVSRHSFRLSGHS